MHPNWDRHRDRASHRQRESRSFAVPDCQEICAFRDTFVLGGLPGPRYVEEMNQEIARIHTQRKELQARQAYWGPTVMGETGELRLRIMACCTIRRRWEAMGIWNPALEILILTGTLGLAPDWPWPSSDPKPHYCGFRAGSRSSPGRPERRKALARHDAASRKYLQGNGEWVNPNSQWKLIAGSDAGENLADHPPRPVSKNNREEFIAGQTWYRFELEVTEQTIKAQRVHPELMAAYDCAYREVAARWKQRRAWKDWWVSGPTWDPPEGVTLPEPEPVDQMSFNGLERHALGIVDWMQGPMLEITADDLAQAPDPLFNLSDADPARPRRPRRLAEATASRPARRRGPRRPGRAPPPPSSRPRRTPTRRRAGARPSASTSG